MPTARTLCIAGGGSGATEGGGGGAGGMLDQNVDLENFTDYDIVVGAGGNAPSTSGDNNHQGNNGGHSYLVPTNTGVQSESFSLDADFDTSTSKQIDVSNFSDEDVIIAEVSTFGSYEFATDFDGDGVFVELDGNDISYGEKYGNQVVVIPVQNIIGGQQNATLEAFTDETSGTVNITFKYGFRIFSIGGGAGGYDGDADSGYSQYGHVGGSGGGGGGGGGGYGGGSGGSGTSGQGNSGGAGDEANSSSDLESGAGGGGGASQSGQHGEDSGAPGGDGASSNITGSSVTYAGGGGGRNASGGAGSNNPGGGGSGAYSDTKDGGQDGIVIFRYNPDNFTHPWKGGDNVYEVNGDMVHEFTSDGTLEPDLSATGFFALNK